MEHQISMNVWCGLLGDQLNGPLVLEQRLTAENYMSFLTNKLPFLKEDMPLKMHRFSYSTMGYLHSLVIKLQLTCISITKINGSVTVVHYLGC
jgi:hypothetical protein